ncbi:MAG: hypothetical protein JW749_10685 [Sedimentisphaerales bacterium]|nr:hypothetical protein [Sedimentisphaerales bacterium]
MSRRNKSIAECLLESYKATGLSRRRFLRRLGMQITGVGAILAAFSREVEACPCRPCNTCNACNGCNASCDTDICLESNNCYSNNTCKYNACIENNTCHGNNSCRTNICEQDDVCTTNVCEGDTCLSDTCGTNTCDFNTCDGNVCEEDDWCTYVNKCINADVDCPSGDISCILANWCVNE